VKLHTISTVSLENSLLRSREIVLVALSLQSTTQSSRIVVQNVHRGFATIETVQLLHPVPQTAMDGYCKMSQSRLESCAHSRLVRTRSP